MNTDKICKNCEHYKCNRSIKNGFLGASVECKYSKDNKCAAYKDQIIASPDCHCNCGRFKLWSAIEMQKDKEKNEREAKKEKQRMAAQTSHSYPNFNENSPVFSNNEQKSALSDIELKTINKSYEGPKVVEKKKVNIVGVIETIIGSIGALLTGTFVIFINGAINLSNEIDAIGLSDEVLKLQKTATVCYIFLGLSLVVITIGIISIIKGKKK